jgi:hypothetical protein
MDGRLRRPVNPLNRYFSKSYFDESVFNKIQRVCKADAGQIVKEQKSFMQECRKILEAIREVIELGVADTR